MKNIKHILSSVLVLVLVLASVSAVTAFASDDDPTLVLSSAEAEAGETVYLELSLENEVGVGVSTINVFFDYDETVLTLPTRKATTKDPVGQKCLSEEYFTDFTNGISPLWLAEDNVYESDLLGSFAFVIAEDAKPGDYEVKLRILDAGFSDIDGEDVPCNTVSGVITVKGEDKVTYENCVDGEGNKLNPYFVNGNVWTETDGVMKPAEGPMENFILFDTPLANNRVEATMNIEINGDKNTRTGIVFAVTDIDGDGEFGYAAADVSYYWVFVSGLNNLGLAEMGAAENWKWHANEVSLATLGIEAEQGITLAAEWDAEGNIKVFANGILAIEAKDATPLTGNLYGVFMRSWANTADAGFKHPHLLTSYVAGGANTAKTENVTVTADPTEGGTVTGTGDYYLGQDATVTATPNAGYNFAGWFWNGNLVSSELTFTFPAGDFDLVAKFTNITYDVTVNAGANGTVAGTGTYAEGASATVTATPNTGYKFVGWYVDDVKVSTDAAYTFAVTANVTLVAEFEKVEYTVPVDAQGNKLNPYYINGNTWIEENGTMKPAPGAMENFILFDNSLNANRIEATFRNLPYNKDGNTRHGIVFAVTDKYDDHLTGINDGGATYYWVCVSGWGELQLIGFPEWKNYTTGGAVDVTQDVTLAVEWDAEGNVKVFVNGELRIEKNVGEPLTGNLYGMLMRSYANTADGGFAHKVLATSFVAGKNTANITVNATEGGVVTGAGEYELGKGATLTATANDGYKFLGWFIGDELVSEAATFIYTVEADAEIVAKFEALVYYDVTVDATEGGNASGSNTVLAGDTVTVVATPNEGYKFLGWFVNGELVSSETTYTFTVEADCEIVAEFEALVYYDVTVGATEGGNASGSNTVLAGDTVTVVATPNEGYKFLGWFVNEELVSSDATYTFTAEADCELTAKFEKITYSVAVDGNGNLLNPYFVSGNIWTEADGTIKPALGPMENFLLFDTPLANNRVEVTFNNLTLNNDGNTRNGIAFALTDIDGDKTFGMGTDDVSYYFACISGWGEIQLIKMGAGKSWTVYLTGGVVDVTGGITLAVEWDAEGNVKVFANEKLCIDQNVGEALTGNLYGVLMRSWANTEGGGYALAYGVNSFVAGNKQATVTATATEGGNASGSNTVLVGDTVTVVATPNEGYKFLGWFVNEELVSSDATYTFTAEADCELTAKFEKLHVCEGEVVLGQGATCTVDGWNDYYACSCGKFYSDAECKNTITDLDAWKKGEGKITASHNHGILVEEVPAVHTATELKAGMKAHYFCDKCSTYFTEEKVATTKEALVIEAPVHVDANNDGKCDVCDKDTGTVRPPQTSDNIMTGVWIIITCISALACLVVIKKRRACN